MKQLLSDLCLFMASMFGLSSQERSLVVCKRQDLRKIFTSIVENVVQSIQTSEENRNLHRESDLVTEIKKEKLRWLGHLEQITPKKQFGKQYIVVPFKRNRPDQIPSDKFFIPLIYIKLKKTYYQFNFKCMCRSCSTCKKKEEVH